MAGLVRYRFDPSLRARGRIEVKAIAIRLTSNRRGYLKVDRFRGIRIEELTHRPEVGETMAIPQMTQSPKVGDWVDDRNEVGRAKATAR